MEGCCPVRGRPRRTGRPDHPREAIDRGAPGAMKPEIVVTGSMYPATLQALDETFATHHLWKAEDPAALLASVRDRVRAIATTGGRGADAALMDALPKLEIISCFA